MTMQSDLYFVWWVTTVVAALFVAYSMVEWALERLTEREDR